MLVAAILSAGHPGNLLRQARLPPLMAGPEAAAAPNAINEDPDIVVLPDSPARHVYRNGREAHPMSATEAASRRSVVGPWNIKFLRPDGFVLSLIAVVLASTLLPCDGRDALIVGTLGKIAIASLFFLQGARLSRDAIVHGLTHWRLHLATASTTFVIFPAIGLGMKALFPTALPPLPWMGVLFACALPSTVQSSIALTSIAKGNVAGAVCSATMSNLAGIFITPLLFGVMSRLHGGAVDAQGIWHIILQLLVPFAAGHLLRPWIGTWAARNRAILSVTDRSSILLVVYTAFSAAVVHGIWHQLPLKTLGILWVVMAALLASGLLITITVSRAFALCTQDEVALVFCGSQKSLVTGVPMASALFSAVSVGPLLLPIMIYYPLQLVVCAWLARRYATASTTMPQATDGAAPGSIESAPKPMSL
jgi:solute carrier family 10 (sodium/bile acid cotransporter), member 7